MAIEILLYLISCIFIWKIMNATYIAFPVRVAAMLMVIVAMRSFVLQ